MAEEDVDVVFEDSALDKYLKEIGIDSSDYELASKRDTPCTVRKSGNSKMEYLKMVKSYIAEEFRWIYNLGWYENCCCVEEMQRHYQSYMKQIFAANVLVEEDQDFLEHWTIEDVPAIDKKEMKSKLTYIVLTVLLCAILNWWLPLYIIMAVTNFHWMYKNSFDLHFRDCIGRSAWHLPSIRNVLAFTGLAFSVINWRLLPPYGILAAMCGTVFMVLLFCGSPLLHHFAMKQHRKNEHHLESFLSSYGKLVTVTRRAINMIQEFELVARGFTLLLSRRPVSQIEQGNLPLCSSYQHCPALRAAVRSCCKKNFMMFREATRSLLRWYRLTSGVDHDSHYLAMLPLEEFATCMNVLTAQETELADCEISVAAIKTGWQFCLLQMSEFIRRFSLCFNSELFGDHTPYIFRDIANIIEPMQLELSSSVKLIKQSYELHKSVALKASSRKQPSRSMQPSHPFYSLQVAVHSIVLHLQSALNRSAALDAQLEKVCERSGDHDQLANGYKEDIERSLVESLESVNLELHSSLTCYEEGMKYFREAFRKTSEVERVPMPSPLPEKRECTDKEPIHLFEIGDPVIEDQVFESIVTEDNFNFDSEEEMFSFDEQDRKKQEAEYSKKVLLELKSILAMKADERRKREEIALAKTCPSRTGDKAVQNKIGERDRCSLDKDAQKADPDSSTPDDHPNETDAEALRDRTSSVPDSSDKRTAVHEEACSSKAGFTRDAEMDEGAREQLEARLEQFSQAPNLRFSANIAALAVAESRKFSGLAEQTFGDGDDEELCS